MIWKTHSAEAVELIQEVKKALKLEVQFKYNIELHDHK